VVGCIVSEFDRRRALPSAEERGRLSALALWDEALEAAMPR
jgi:hypothetical protein